MRLIKATKTAYAFAEISDEEYIRIQKRANERWRKGMQIFREAVAKARRISDAEADSVHRSR
jgi:hypothetical protein